MSCQLLKSMDNDIYTFHIIGNNPSIVIVSLIFSDGYVLGCNCLVDHPKSTDNHINYSDESINVDEGCKFPKYDWEQIGPTDDGD